MREQTDLKTEVEQLEGNKVKLKVEVSAKVLDGALKDAYRDLAKRLYVPGFRKGKVPAKVIDAQIGKDNILASAAEKVINARYPEAIVRTGVDPMEQPEVNVVQAEAGKDLIFEADIEVKPEAKLGEYKGVEVKVPNVDVTDEELDVQLNVLRERFARLEVVEDRAVETGDYVLIDYRGTLDGKPFDGSSADDYMVEIGSGTLLEELEEGITGASRGEDRHITASFPEDFRNKEVAGKAAEFDVKVKEIKKKILPDADDDFVSETTEHETLEDLKTDLKRKLEVMKRAQTKVQAEGKVIDIVAEAAEVQLPEKLVEAEIDSMTQELETNLKRQNATMEEYLALTESTMDKLREEFTEEAKKRIGRELAIIAVAKAENIEVSREEMDSEVAQIARAMEKPLAEVQRQIQQKGTLPELHASLLRRKTVDWLATHAKAVTESGDTFEMTPPPPGTASEVVNETRQSVEQDQEKQAQEVEASGEAAEATPGEGDAVE